MAGLQVHGARQILAASITNDRFFSPLGLQTAQLQDGASFIQRTGTVAFTANQSMGGFQLNNIAAGTLGTDAVNLSQIQAIANGVAVQRTRVVATTNQTLSALPTIDGITLVAGQQVLLTAQSTASQNGPWAVAAGAWTRPTDWAAASSQQSTIFFVTEGTTYHDSRWLVISDNITVDTTSVSVTQDLAGTNYSANTAAGLSLTGSTFAVKVGNGIGFDGSGNVQAVADPTPNNITVAAAGISIKAGTPGQLMLAAVTTGAGTFTTITGDVTVSSAGVTSVNATAAAGFLKYSNIVSNETPTGTLNGTNQAFTLANTPAVGSQQVYVNGLLYEPGAGNDYTISGVTITFALAPITTDKIRVYYDR